MKYYQADFLSEWLPITPKSIGLFISSVPLEILDNECGLFFGILNRYMKADGFICIDMPEGLNQQVITLYSAVEASGWTKYRHHYIKDAYVKGKDQIIQVYRKQRGVAGVNHPLSVDTERKMSHPCEFCPGLIKALIEMYSNEGDIVLDAFCGTGTVMKVAEKMGRHGVGVDLRPKENIQ